MSEIGNIALRVSMALIKEQRNHPNRCPHCNYSLSAISMVASSGVSLSHDASCPVVAAKQLVEAFNSELISVDA